ncbi:hypothetical protein CAEBREN_15379 [Caenorhabditis brenneri]|uniref:Uncharacterized protein n=1 Tax=Caenorhabditis brenneri TaxID=135651 RepID=G0P459_CAEBE|nr:hypothetical protein CAEBREN_15379 [Caenorhabditis brenneri]
MKPVTKAPKMIDNSEVGNNQGEQTDQQANTAPVDDEGTGNADTTGNALRDLPNAVETPTNGHQATPPITASAANHAPTATLASTGASSNEPLDSGTGSSQKKIRLPADFPTRPNRNPHIATMHVPFPPPLLYHIFHDICKNSKIFRDSGMNQIIQDGTARSLLQNFSDVTIYIGTDDQEDSGTPAEFRFATLTLPYLLPVHCIPPHHLIEEVFGPSFTLIGGEEPEEEESEDELVDTETGTPSQLGAGIPDARAETRSISLPVNFPTIPDRNPFIADMHVPFPTPLFKKILDRSTTYNNETQDSGNDPKNPKTARSLLQRFVTVRVYIGTDEREDSGTPAKFRFAFMPRYLDVACIPPHLLVDEVFGPSFTLIGGLEPKEEETENELVNSEAGTSQSCDDVTARSRTQRFGHRDVEIGNGSHLGAGIPDARAETRFISLPVFILHMHVPTAPPLLHHLLKGTHSNSENFLNSGSGQSYEDGTARSFLQRVKNVKIYIGNGQDAGSDDGQDAGSDDGQDAGSDDGQDAGSDDGQDAGSDDGQDAGSDDGQDADKYTQIPHLLPVHIIPPHLLVEEVFGTSFTLLLAQENSETVTYQSFEDVDSSSLTQKFVPRYVKVETVSQLGARIRGVQAGAPFTYYPVNVPKSVADLHEYCQCLQQNLPTLETETFSLTPSRFLISLTPHRNSPIATMHVPTATPLLNQIFNSIGANFENETQDSEKGQTFEDGTARSLLQRFEDVLVYIGGDDRQDGGILGEWRFVCEPIPYFLPVHCIPPHLLVNEVFGTSFKLIGAEELQEEGNETGEKNPDGGGAPPEKRSRRHSASEDHQESSSNVVANDVQPDEEKEETGDKKCEKERKQGKRCTDVHTPEEEKKNKARKPNDSE